MKRLYAITKNVIGRRENKKRVPSDPMFLDAFLDVFEKDGAFILGY